MLLRFTRRRKISGEIAVTNEILQLVIREGARLASLPGELTQTGASERSGRFDGLRPSRDIIRAKTDKAMNIAAKAVGRLLSDLINNTRQEILNTLAQVESTSTI